MLMDISSEIIHSLLPLFMVTTLGTSVIFIGLIEGLAEATALFIKIFSGAISDYIGKRKGLAVLGYGLGALSKPLFAIASSSGMILGARLIDRVGKGYAQHHEMHWSRMLRHRNCAVQRLACVSQWTRSALFSAPFWQYG
jgi:MFS family permease